MKKFLFFPYFPPVALTEVQSFGLKVVIQKYSSDIIDKILYLGQKILSYENFVRQIFVR